MYPPHARSAAFTLVELMIVVALVGILAGLAISHFQPPLAEQLKGAASIVVADLDYARSLAITNNSTYRVTFEPQDNRYVLTHAGGNPVLDSLPPAPFRPASDSAGEHTTDLDRIPHLGATVHLHGAYKTAASSELVGDVEFGPLGGTARPETTVVWLRCGVGDSRRFLPLTVNPITGLMSVGEMQAKDPAAQGQVETG